MFECCKPKETDLCWAITVGKSISTATGTTWICLGGCRNHTNALRVYQARKSSGGH